MNKEKLFYLFLDYHDASKDYHDQKYKSLYRAASEDWVLDTIYWHKATKGALFWEQLHNLWSENKYIPVKNNKMNRVLYPKHKICNDYLVNFEDLND